MIQTYDRWGYEVGNGEFVKKADHLVAIESSDAGMLRAVNEGLVEEGKIQAEQIAALKAEVVQWKRVLYAHVEEIERLKKALEKVMQYEAAGPKRIAKDALKPEIPERRGYEKG